MSRLKKLSILSALVIFSLVLSACSAAPDLTAAESQAPPLKKVKVEAVKAIPLGEPVTVEAMIVPAVEVTLAAEIGGKVEVYNAKVGNNVTKGDLILKLDQDELNLSLKRAQIAKEKQLLQMDTMKEQLRNAESSLDNQISQMQLGLNEVELSIQDVQQQINKTIVKSPINGIIVEAENLNPGQLITSGQHLMTIQQLDQLYIEAKVTEQDILYISQKRKLDVHFPVLNKTLSSNIDYVSPSASAGGKFAIRLSLHNPNGMIRPGMSAHLILNDDLAQAVTSVPIGSVLEEDGEHYVFVYTDGKVVKTTIEIGRKTKDVIEVVSGLNLHDQIVIAGQSQLKNNDKVEVAGP